MLNPWHNSLVETNDYDTCAILLQPNTMAKLVTKILWSRGVRYTDIYCMAGNFSLISLMIIVCMEFTIESCVQGHCFSEEFCTPKEKSWLVCQREESDPNDVYTVTVKTHTTKTVQIMRNNDLSSLQWNLIIDFVLTEQKLAHDSVKFPVCAILL